MTIFPDLTTQTNSLLRAYEKEFLRDLVHAARDRYRQEAFGSAA